MQYMNYEIILFGFNIQILYRSFVNVYEELNSEKGAVHLYSAMQGKLCIMQCH